MRSLLRLTFVLFVTTRAQAALPRLDGVFINVEQPNLAGVVIDLANRDYRIVVVQYSSNTYNEKATRFTELDTIFETAADLANKKQKKDRKFVDIYVGLYFDESWNRAWESGAAALEPFLTQNIKTIKDIDSRYGNHARFKGWYIAHEIGNVAGLDADIAADFFGRIAKTCRAYDKKRGKERPVLVSAYFNPHEKHLQPSQFAKRLGTIQECAEFSRVLLQDGVGERRLDPEKLTALVTPFYDQTRRTLGKNHLWGVIELFCCSKIIDDCQCVEYSSGRGTDQRLKKQKDAIARNVSKVVAFQFRDLAKKPDDCATKYCDVATDR